MVSIAPEGQEAQSKTLKVAEKADPMEVLKANTRLRRRVASSPDRWRSPDEQGTLINVQDQWRDGTKKGQKQLSKMGILSNFYQEAYQ